MTRSSTLLVAVSFSMIVLLVLGGVIVQARAGNMPSNATTNSSLAARKEDLVAHQLQLQATVDRLNATLEQQLAMEQALSNELTTLTGQVQQQVQRPAPQPVQQPAPQPIRTMPIRTTRAS